MKVSEILQKVKSYTQKRKKNSTNSESDYSECDNDFSKCVEKYTISEEDLYKIYEVEEEDYYSDIEREYVEADDEKIRDIMKLARQLYSQEEYEELGETIERQFEQCLQAGVETSIGFVIFLENLLNDLTKEKQKRLEKDLCFVRKGVKKKEEEEIEFN